LTFSSVNMHQARPGQTEPASHRRQTCTQNQATGSGRADGGGQQTWKPDLPEPLIRSQAKRRDSTNQRLSTRQTGKANSSVLKLETDQITKLSDSWAHRLKLKNDARRTELID